MQKAWIVLYNAYLSPEKSTVTFSTPLKGREKKAGWFLSLYKGPQEASSVWAHLLLPHRHLTLGLFESCYRYEQSQGKGQGHI